MAGIGFKLQKYFSENDLLQNVRGTLYSVVISSGPWLISVLTIGIVSYFAQRDIIISDLFILKSIICYTFAASLIIFGVIEMPLTRYLADQLFKNDVSTFKSLYLVLIALLTAFGSLTGYAFYLLIPEISLLVKLSAITFYVSVLIIWTSMMFLSAAKNYRRIVHSFILGSATSVFSCYYLGREYGLDGYVLGYTIGQYLIAVSLAFFVFNEFKGIDYLSFEFLKYFKKCRLLVWAGLFYYLGIWVDKFLFWIGPEGEHVLGPFYTNKYYDTAMFLAYITIVPSLAIFMVQVETNFYRFYSYYFHSIDQQNPLPILNENIQDIMASLKRKIFTLIKAQLLITLTCWYFAEEILEFLYLPSMVTTIFKYGVIGAMLQSLMLTMNIILLYFLSEKSVLKHYFLFFALNALLTYISTFWGYRFYGFGYLASTIIVFYMTLSALTKHMKNLNFYTFMSQPID